MDTHIKLKRLDYADLLKLGELASEALALSQDYDQQRTYTRLVAACNGEVLARKREKKRQCGTAA